MNFSLRDTLAMAARLQGEGFESDLFHANFIPGMDLSRLMDSCRRTKRLILVDDSKTVTKFGDAIVAEVVERMPEVGVLSLHRRGCADVDYGANDDRFVPDTDKALAFLRRA